MWGSRGRGRASMNSLLSEKNVVRTRSEPGRGGYRVKFFLFSWWQSRWRDADLMLADQLRVHLRSCICYCLRMQQWKQHHILMQAYKQRQRPRGFVECTDISYFCTHIVSSLKCFCQTIKIHKIEKSLSWSQYFNHPTISRQWCVASLRIQRSKPGK